MSRGYDAGMRVVSLLPSATEVLCAIGAADLLVGRSHECDAPHSITDRPILTSQRIQASGDGQSASGEIDTQVREALQRGESLYVLDVDRLRELAPEVILTQDLCAVCSIDLNTVRSVAAKMDPQPRIVSLNPHSIEDVFDDLLRVGEAVGREQDAERAMVSMRERYWTARDYVNPYADGVEVAFLEWMDPLFVGGHWTPQLIEAAGGRHSLNPAGATSREVEPHELVGSLPERIIICPCGYDLAAIESELPTLTGAEWWQRLSAVRNGQVVMVDGNQMFNRPGPRLVDAYCWLVSWLNDRPDVPGVGDFPARPIP